MGVQALGDGAEVVARRIGEHDPVAAAGELRQEIAEADASVALAGADLGQRDAGLQPGRQVVERQIRRGVGEPEAAECQNGYHRPADRALWRGARRGAPRAAEPGAHTPPTTPPPPPSVEAPSVVVRTHPVASSWRHDSNLAPARRRSLASEILTLAVERSMVVCVTGVRGLADDKSVAAAELALALSEAKHPRVLLMESDFQFPQVQKWLGLDVPLVAGFSQQLRGRMDSARIGRWHVIECKPSLHVLAEGIMRTPGLLLSNLFEKATRELRTYYDVIVIDAPIAPNESDGQAIADVVDGATSPSRPPVSRAEPARVNARS